MKKLLIIFLICFSLLGFSGCDGCNDVVRIHIRGNSNLSIDQEVKLVVRDKVVEFITPLLSTCENSGDVKNVLEDNLEEIENIADGVLKDCGFEYVSTAKLNNEYFPTREYGGVVFSADYYDALILELGSGSGDNWWCVAYPPLCFVGDYYDSGEVKYKSKLVELINNFLGR